MTLFADSLPMVLNRALDAVLPPYREIFARFNLTEQQWRILRVLWERKTISSIELARTCLIPPPSLVGVLDRLEARDLVARFRSQEDRRLVLVEVTEDGRAIANEVMPMVDEIHHNLRARVTPEEWGMLQSILQKFENDRMAFDRAG